MISVSASSLLVSNSLVKKLILGSFIVSCCVPIILSVFYCILTEVTVSIEEFLEEFLHSIKTAD